MKDFTEEENDLKIIGNLSQAIEVINLKIKNFKEKKNQNGFKNKKSRFQIF